MASFDGTQISREGEFFLQSAQLLINSFEGILHVSPGAKRKQKHESSDDSKLLLPKSHTRSNSLSNLFASFDDINSTTKRHHHQRWPKKWRLSHDHTNNSTKRASVGAVSVATDPNSVTDSEDTSSQQLVEWCIEQIDKVEPMRLKGIYRVSGNAGVIARLQRCFERQLLPDFEADVYSIADLLKRHFRNKYPPLFPPGRFQDSIVAACRFPNDTEQQISAIRQALSELPSGNFELCRALFRHLWQISKHEDVTKMTINNLSTFWAPNLFYFMASSSSSSTANAASNSNNDVNKSLQGKGTSVAILETAAEIQVKIHVVEAVIKNFEQIFMQTLNHNT